MILVHLILPSSTSWDVHCTSEAAGRVRLGVREQDQAVGKSRVALFKMSFSTRREENQNALLSGICFCLGRHGMHKDSTS